MSTLKVDAIRHNSATSDAITTAADGTCTGKITNYPHRNLFLNGALNISQRGNSYSSANAYTADQWYMFATGSTTTRETSSPPDGFTYYLRCPSTSNSIIFSQQIELDAQGKVGKYKNKTVTVSWYARTESSNTMYVDAAFKNASGGGDYTAVRSGTSDIKTLTSSWARYSSTFTISATPHANNKCFSIMIRTPSSGSGSTGTLEATGFQCEFGDTATDFEHVSNGEEYIRCSRHLVQYNNLGTSDDQPQLFLGVAADNNDLFGQIFLPNAMRAHPTLSYSSADHFAYTRVFGGGSGVVGGSLFISYATSFPHQAMPMRANCSPNPGWSQGDVYLIRMIGGNNGYLRFSAEI